MGDLVMFRPRSNATPGATRRSESGEIVFFTGVRYERIEPPAGHDIGQPPPAGGLNGAGRGKRKKRA